MSNSVNSTGGNPPFPVKSTTSVVGRSDAYGMKGPSAPGIGGTDNVVVIDVGATPRHDPGSVHETGNVRGTSLKK